MMRYTLADYLFPAQTPHGARRRDWLLISGSSTSLALCSLPLFHMMMFAGDGGFVLGITLQFLGVLLIGAVLGKWRGCIAVLFFLVEGAVLFSLAYQTPNISFPFGELTLVALFGPFAGYFWSLPVVAFVTGLLCEKQLDRSFLTSTLAILPGIFIINVTSALGLYFWNPAGGFTLMPDILSYGYFLALPIAVVLLPSMWKLLHPKSS